MATSKLSAHPTWSTANKVGLALLAVHGLANLPRALLDGPAPGEIGPPSSILYTEAVLGAVVIVTAVVAWVRGSRAASRLSCAAIVLISLTALPAFFADVSALMRLYAAAGILWTVVSVVLALAPRRTTTAPATPVESNA